ncbi:MAG TPA: hypothetical protein VMV43_01405 [Candidatus Nanopelagicaceae bacterium]|nr:hypothetical protein [Candidatus Nanopelagicaceae bacterium]
MLMEDPILKDYIVGDIIKEVEEKGLSIEKDYVESFIDNFISEYERLPKKSEINPIVSSYIKILERKENSSEIIERSHIYSSGTETSKALRVSVIEKNKMLNSIKNEGLFGRSEEILTIPKSQGRRLCPICDDGNWYKIHELIDKNDVICDYPRIYGKKYICSGCSCVWKEK